VRQTSSRKRKKQTFITLGEGGKYSTTEDEKIDAVNSLIFLFFVSQTQQHYRISTTEPVNCDLCVYVGADDDPNQFGNLGEWVTPSFGWSIMFFISHTKYIDGTAQKFSKSPCE